MPERHPWEGFCGRWMNLSFKSGISLTKVCCSMLPLLFPHLLDPYVIQNEVEVMWHNPKCCCGTTWIEWPWVLARVPIELPVAWPQQRILSETVWNRLEDPGRRLWLPWHHEFAPQWHTLIGAETSSFPDRKLPSDLYPERKSIFTTGSFQVRQCSDFSQTFWGWFLHSQTGNNLPAQRL